LAERVLVVAVYYRSNLTMRQLGPLFGVYFSTVCRVIHRLGPLSALDGALIPLRDRQAGAFGRNCRFSANVQVVVDAEPAS
jgi:hypothetical protein